MKALQNLLSQLTNSSILFCLSLFMLASYTPLSAQLGEISGTVWDDTNQDGIQDSSESVLPNYAIHVVASGEIWSAVTNENGVYTISDLPNDYYMIGVNLNIETCVTTLTNFGVEISESLPSQTVDFGINTDCQNTSSTIQGTVWFDENGDGDLDIQEIGAAGMVIQQIDENDNVVAIAVTNASGYYSFNYGFGSYFFKLENYDDIQLTTPDGYYTNSIEGTPVTTVGNFGLYTSSPCPVETSYTGILEPVQFCPQFCNLTTPLEDLNITNVVATYSGTTSWFPDEGNCVEYFPLPAFVGVDTVLVEACDPTTGECEISLNYVYVGETGQIEGNVFLDNNFDGIPQETEGGLINYSMSLYDTNGNLIDGEFSGPEGNFAFTNLIVGETYEVVLELQGNDCPTTPTIVEVDLEELVAVVNFGFDPICNDLATTVSGIVWFDTNGNGLYEVGEMTVPSGTFVECSDGNGNVVAITTTDPSGNYNFNNFGTGIYTFSLPGYAADQLSTPASYTISLDAGGEVFLDMNFGIYEALPCPTETYTTGPVQSIEICPEFCNLTAPLETLIDLDVSSIFECSISILDNNCFNYTPLPGMELMGYDNLIVAACDPNTIECDTVEIEVLIENDECDFDANFTATFIEGYGTDDVPQSSATSIYDLSANTNDPFVDYYLWTLDGDSIGNGPMVTDVALPSIQNGVPQGPYMICLTVGNISEDCLKTFCSGLNPAGTNMISGTVWSDDNNNTIIDNGETFIENVEIILYDDSNNLIATINSDTDGYYHFSNLLAGTYTVEIEGYGIDELTTPSTASIDLYVGNSETYNFGLLDCTFETITHIGSYLDNPSIICPEFCSIGPLASLDITSIESLFDCNISLLEDNCIEFLPFPSFWGSENLVITACDPTTGICETQQIMVEVIQDFVADDLDFTILPEEVLEINLQDYYPAPINVIIVQQVVFGVTTISEDLIFYTPNSGFIGVESFDYQICMEGTGACASGTITISVEGDVPPIISLQDDFFTITVNEALNLCPTTNDDYIGVGSLIAIESVENGTVTENPSPLVHCFDFEPALDFVGVATIVYSICDPETGYCEEATISILVEGIEDLNAEDDYESTDLNTQVLIEHLDNDYSFFAEVVTSVIVPPSNGTVLLLSPPTDDCIGFDCEFFSYTPNLNYEGTDEFDYTICYDGKCDTATVFVSVGVDCSEFCVWPGDANNDGVANNFDLLSIGLLYGTTGTPRNNPNIDWVPQQSFAWGIETYQATDTNGDSILVDAKYTDCDGNGLIDNNDAFAITANYGFTHGKTEEVVEAATSPTISLEVQEASIQPGDWVNVDIKLNGEFGEALEDFYGIAFQIDYFNEYDEDEQVIVGDSVMASFGDSWVNNNGNDFVLTMAKNLYEINDEYTKIDFAITRTNQVGIDGNGDIGTLSALITQNITGKTAADIPLNFYVKNAFVLYGNGEVRPIQNAAITSQVIVSGIEELPEIYESQVEVFPNPARGYLNVIVPETNLETIKILNLMGQAVLQIDQLKGEQVELDVANLPDGIYYLSIQTDKGLLNRQIEIIH